MVTARHTRILVGLVVIFIVSACSPTAAAPTPKAAPTTSRPVTGTVSGPFNISIINVATGDDAAMFLSKQLQLIDTSSVGGPARKTAPEDLKAKRSGWTNVMVSFTVRNISSETQRFIPRYDGGHGVKIIDSEDFTHGPLALFPGEFSSHANIADYWLASGWWVRLEVFGELPTSQKVKGLDMIICGGPSSNCVTARDVKVTSFSSEEEVRGFPLDVPSESIPHTFTCDRFAEFTIHQPVIEANGSVKIPMQVKNLGGQNYGANQVWPMYFDWMVVSSSGFIWIEQMRNEKLVTMPRLSELAAPGQVTQGELTVAFPRDRLGNILTNDVKLHLFGPWRTGNMSSRDESAQCTKVRTFTLG